MLHYLLPCECGRKLAVSAAQAGERVDCACGKQLDVPTLRGLQSLERQADAAAQPEHAPWGWRQGVAFLGGSICVLALLALGVLQLRKPISRADALQAVIPEHIDFKAISPAAVWGDWYRVRMGIQRQLTPAEMVALQSADSMRTTWNQWRLMAVVAAGIGLALVLICVALGQMAVKGRPRSPAARRPVKPTGH